VLYILFYSWYGSTCSFLHPTETPSKNRAIRSAKRTYINSPTINQNSTTNNRRHYDIGQTDDDLIIEFSVSNEWSNRQEISKTATIQDFINLYESITPDEVTNLKDTLIVNTSFN